MVPSRPDLGQSRFGLDEELLFIVLKITKKTCSTVLGLVGMISLVRHLPSQTPYLSRNSNVMVTTSKKESSFNTHMGLA
jgi:hypothetical protein